MPPEEKPPKEEWKRRWTNMGWTLGGKGGEILLSFVVGLATARYLGPHYYGGITVAIIINGFFRRLSTGGLWLPTSRLIAICGSEDERLEYEAAARVIVRKASWIWTGGCLATAALLPKEYGWPLAITALALPGNTGDCRAWALHANLQSKQTIVADRCAQLARSGTQIILLLAGAPAWLFGLTVPAAEWTKTILLGRCRGRATEEKIMSLQKESAKLKLGVLTKYLAATLPTILVGSVSASAVGLLAAASRINNTLIILPQIYTQSNAPAVMGKTRDWKAPWLYVTAVTALLCIPIILAADWIIPVLYGSEFGPAASATKWLAVGLIASVGNPILEAKLTSDGKNDTIRCWWTIAPVAGLGIGMLLWASGATLWDAGAAAIATGQVLGCLGMLPTILNTKNP